MIERPDRNDLVVLLIDVQEKFMPVIDRKDMLLHRCRLILEAAKVLSIPVITTEQYVKGLGPTVPELASLLSDPAFEKMAFSSLGCDGAKTKLSELGRKGVIVIGIEAHVCVYQTVADLLSDQYRVFLPVDAITCRRALDRETALRSMERGGATLTTTESLILDLIGSAAAPEFKELLPHLKEIGPVA